MSADDVVIDAGRVASGDHGPIGDVKDHRPERHGVPLLGAQAHPQPEQLASSAGRDD